MPTIMARFLSMLLVFSAHRALACRDIVANEGGEHVVGRTLDPAMNVSLRPATIADAAVIAAGRAAAAAGTT